MFNMNADYDGDLIRVPAGCDSGFGKATAMLLDTLGFEVFATVLDLTGEGARELQRICSPRLTLLQVDITQPQQVQQALLDVKARLDLKGTKHCALVRSSGDEQDRETKSLVYILRLSIQ